MDVDEIFKLLDADMAKAVDHTLRDFTTLHTGKASASMVENINVDSYGSMMKLKEMSAITTPDMRTIQIQPWDRGVVDNIVKALIASNIGITPLVNGPLIRLPIPDLSGERRKELGKVAHGMAEQGKVSIRSIRRDAMDSLKQLKKDGDISEDDFKRDEKEVQTRTDKFVAKIDACLQAKETDLKKV